MKPGRLKMRKIWESCVESERRECKIPSAAQRKKKIKIQKIMLTGNANPKQIGSKEVE